MENLANIDKWFANGKISFEEKEKYRTLLRKIPEFQYTINAYDKIGKDAIISADIVDGTMSRTLTVENENMENGAEDYITKPFFI